MAATDIDYSSLQDIREESGHQHVVKLASMTGTADGANTSFYVARTYVVDRDYDDSLAAADVVVYDDSVAVTATSVNGTTGEIVLDSAPAASSVMKCTYAWSALSDAKVTKYRNEAISFVQRRLKGILDYTTWDSSDVPDELKTITRMYAAALILIRDHGSSADTELTSKDGYKRLGWAKKALKEYIQAVSDDADASTPVTASTKTDGQLFERESDLDDWTGTVTEDEHFMRGD